MKNESRISIPILVAALAGGLLVGYVDLTAQEVQGPALILMVVTFLCATPRRAPGWLIAIAATLGLPLAHAIASLANMGDPPNAGMFIAIVPAMIAAYVGVATGLLVQESARALGSDIETSLARPALIFAGLAACCALGAPILRNVLYLARMYNGWWIATVWQSVTLVAWCGIAVAIVRNNALLLSRPGGAQPRDVLAHVVRLVAGTLVHTALLFIVVKALFIHLSGPVTGMFFVYIFLAYLPLDALCYMTIILLGYASDRERIAKENARHTAELTAAVDQSRLAALNAQLRPHFMFNSLNTVVVLARRGDARAAGEAATALADMMRYILDSAEQPGPASLREEVAFIESYLDLERLRFEDRLTTEVVCDVGVSQIQIPRLLLQPIVENAVRHGIEKSARGGRVEVSVKRQGDALEVLVKNDGAIISVDGLNAMSGLGLRATRARLAALYDTAASLSYSSDARGTIARILIPA